MFVFAMLSTTWTFLLNGPFPNPAVTLRSLIKTVTLDAFDL